MCGGVGYLSFKEEVFCHLVLQRPLVVTGTVCLAGVAGRLLPLKRFLLTVQVLHRSEVQEWQVRLEEAQ